jgi:hypothetical protein
MAKKRLLRHSMEVYLQFRFHISVQYEQKDILTDKLSKYEVFFAIDHLTTNSLAEGD